MKKIIFLWLLLFLFSFSIGLWIVGVNAANEDDYTLKINSKGLSSDRILIMNWAFSGDYNEFDIYSSIDWDHYRFVDTVEIKKWTYTYNLPCWIQLFWFKFVPKLKGKVKKKIQYTYWKEFEYKTNVGWASWKCRPLPSAAPIEKLDPSYVISWTSVVLTWTATSWSSDVEVKVAKNWSDTFSSIAIVPMTGEKFVYDTELFDRGLRFALVPRNLYWEAFVYSWSIFCFNRNCWPQENLSTVIFWVLQHTVDTQKNQITFQWENKLAWVNLNIELFTNWKFRKVDTIKLMNWTYNYKYWCWDKELVFKFSLEDAEWIEYLYRVEVDSSNLNCTNTWATVFDTKGLNSGWYWFVGGDQSAIVNNWLTRELDNALKFAQHYRLTSAASVRDANLNWNITRAAMAKMISNFAKNALGVEPDVTRSCSFPDVPTSLDREFGNWITEACQLWIMWVWISNFKPYETVLRAEFWTILSRLIFWNKDWDPYYQPHLNALKSANIIKDWDPFKIEKRWNVLLMLMRSAQKIWVSDWSYSKDILLPSETYTAKKTVEKTLFTIVELVDDSLLDFAKSVRDFDWSSENYQWGWADMSNANVCVSNKTWDNTLSFYRDPVILSDDVEVRLYDDKGKYQTLGTVPMLYWNFKYSYTGKDSNLLFAFTPRNAKWATYRYELDYHAGSWYDTCKWDRVEISDEVIEVINKLWKDANVLWLLLPSIREKDQQVIKNLKNLMISYKESDDEYNHNVGVYLWYLLWNN